MERSMLIRRAVIASRRTRSQNGGFTLVELAVVVAIVGILSVIALVGYRKYMLSAKVSEARQMIGGIRLAQEDRRAEKGTYANLGATFCPTSAGKSNVKVGWDSNCSGGNAGGEWRNLAVHADGPVQFSYATIAGNSGKATDPPFANFGPVIAFNSITGNQADRPWYVVGAQCDLDGDTGNVNTMLAGSSYENTIHSANEGN